jgi:hypothetical protein
MERIRDLQYDNLRSNFNENLVEPILGKDYYNMGHDVYQSDVCTTQDLKREFDKREKSIKKYKFLFHLFLASSLVLCTLIIRHI